MKANKKLLQQDIKFTYCTIFAFLLLLTFPSLVIAQPCDFQNHGAILVKVIDAGTSKPIKGLKIYLAFEKGQPITNTAESRISANILAQDTFLFWENKAKNIPNTNSKCAIKRARLINAQDHYICIVPNKSGLNDLSLFSSQNGITTVSMPWSPQIHLQQLGQSYFLKLKIEDIDNEKNGGLYRDQLLSIPIAAVTDICRNNLFNLDGKINKNISLDPLVIELKPNDTSFKAEVKHHSFGHYLVPFYNVYGYSYSDMKENFNNCELEKIELFDELSQQILQRIEPPYSHSKRWTKGKIEFANFRNETRPRKLGFRVPVENIPYEQKPQQYFYYYYNTETHLYEEDQLINSKDNLTFDEKTQRIQSLEEISTTDKTIFNRYEMQNQEWRLIATSTFEKPESERVKNKVAKCYFIESHRNLPVQYFKNTRDNETGITTDVTDTFWIVNYGNVSANLKVNSIGRNNYFDVPKIIKPNEKLPIIYNRRWIYRERAMNTNFGEVQGFFELVSDALTIEYDGQEVNASISYTMIAKDAIVTTQSDGSLLFNQRFHRTMGAEQWRISTFPSGHLKEYGQMANGTKIGQWTIIDSSEKYFVKKEQYAKRFYLQIANPSDKECKVQLVSAWNMTEDKYVAGQPIYIDSTVKQLIVRRDSAVATYTIDFENLQERDGATLYLLYPNQDYFYYGKVKIPLDVNHQQYKIQFNTNNPRIENNVDFFEMLLKKYPKLQYYDVAANNNNLDKFRRFSSPFYIIDLSSCSSKEKNKILADLEENSNISFISQPINYNSKSFNGNTIYILQNNNKPLDATFLEKAKFLGFNYTGITAGTSTYQHNFIYQSKIIDKVFYIAFNKLCEAFDLGKISLNTYSVVEMD